MFYATGQNNRRKTRQMIDNGISIVEIINARRQESKREAERTGKPEIKMRYQRSCSEDIYHSGSAETAQKSEDNKIREL